MTCIWCLKPITQPSIEHGIPESLNCPPDLILEGVVCKSCNTTLGRIDRALLKQFEVQTVMYGVPRKKDRAPTIDSWRGIASKQKADGAHIFINAGPGTVDAEGQTLHPVTKANGVHDVWMEPETGKLGFKQQLGNDPRFVPALYKIGLNLVARHWGVLMAASPDYDHIRAFVRGAPGAPNMRAVMLPNPIISAQSGGSAPCMKGSSTHPMFEIMVLGMIFVLDMAPDQPGLRDFRGAATLRGERLLLFPPNGV